MVITPNTDLYLVKVPLEINDDNQLTFANASAQYTYFSSLPRIDGDGRFTYQRKDGVIRFGALIDDILEYNYVMYRNTSYSSKWFYAYITGMEYANDNMTNIAIKTDVWQTWQFDLTYKPVLIDREHQNTDVAGDNTLPEGLELGEFVTSGSVSDIGLDGGVCTIVDVTMVENEGESSTLSYDWTEAGSFDTRPFINGMPSGVIHLVVGFFENATTYTSPDALIDAYDWAGLGNAIVNVYCVPRELIGTTSDVHKLSISATRDGTTKTVSNLAILKDTFAEKINSTTWHLSKPTFVDSYQPKNQKLFTWPYSFFNISNNAGTSLPYHYEDFSTTTCDFKIASALSPSGSVKCYPLNYKNLNGTTENSYDYGITGGKFPIGAWVNDSYTNWLTQNAVNMRTQWTQTLLGGVLGMGGSTFEGYQTGKAVSTPTQNVVGKMTALGAVQGAVQFGSEVLKTALNQHLAKTQANMVPDTAGGNINVGDLMWGKNRCKFTFMPMSVKAEYARCIDEFFSQFGYKCNRVKLPNITGRRNWNFVKTVGCYIEADIPQDDLQEIKSMFDKGITFWHNPATFADYSQSNDII